MYVSAPMTWQVCLRPVGMKNSPVGVLTDVSHQVLSLSHLFSRNEIVNSIQQRFTLERPVPGRTPPPGCLRNTHKSGNGALRAGAPAGPEATLCVICPTFNSRVGTERILAELGVSP